MGFSCLGVKAQEETPPKERWEGHFEWAKSPTSGTIDFQLQSYRPNYFEGTFDFHFEPPRPFHLEPESDHEKTAFYRTTWPPECDKGSKNFYSGRREYRKEFTRLPMEARIEGDRLCISVLAPDDEELVLYDVNRCGDGFEAPASVTSYFLGECFRIAKREPHQIKLDGEAYDAALLKNYREQGIDLATGGFSKFSGILRRVEGATTEPEKRSGSGLLFYWFWVIFALMMTGLAGAAAAGNLLTALKKGLWKTSHWTYSSALAAAWAGAIFSAMEKLKEWSVIVASTNSRTGLPIAGDHLAYPLHWLGRIAQFGGAGLALWLQFKESKAIWEGSGSMVHRTAKELASLSVNLFVTGSSIALVGALAATGPGMVAGFAGAAALGIAGEGAKVALFKLLDAYVK